MRRGYDAILDAEYILEEILHRKRWNSETRDNLAEALTLIDRGQPLREKTRGRQPYRKSIGRRPKFENQRTSV